MKTIKAFSVIAIVTGLLGKNVNAQSPVKPVSPAEMVQEVNLIKTAFIALHPGIYRYETPHQVDSVFDEYRRKVNKNVSAQQYYILLSQLLTNVKCSHTYVNPYNQTKSTRNDMLSKSFMPFLFRIVDGRMIITHNLSGNKKIKQGAEVLSINGIAVKKIIDSLLSVSRSDGRHGLAKRIDNINVEPGDIGIADYTLFDTYAPLFFQDLFNAGKYILEVTPYARRSFLTEAASLTKQQRQAKYVLCFGDVPFHEKGWVLKFEKRNTAVLKISDFETWEWKADYKKWLDSVFSLLATKHVSNLIIDIRGNEGGDDEARDEVLSYLADCPLGCDDRMHRLYRFLSIPDALKPYLTTWDKTFEQAKNPDDYVLHNGFYESKADLNAPCTPTAPKGNSFKGTKFLLTDARNSSTSFTLANAFQKQHIGKIIGEPTSGNKRGINGGQFFFFNLPHSKFEIDIPLVWGSYDGNNPDEGVMPDYVVKGSQKAIHENRDIQMEYIFSRLIQN